MTKLELQIGEEKLLLVGAVPPPVNKETKK